MRLQLSATYGAELIYKYKISKNTFYTSNSYVYVYRVHNDFYVLLFSISIETHFFLFTKLSTLQVQHEHRQQLQHCTAVLHTLMVGLTQCSLYGLICVLFSIMMIIFCLKHLHLMFVACGC